MSLLETRSPPDVDVGDVVSFEHNGARAEGSITSIVPVYQLKKKRARIHVNDAHVDRHTDLLQHTADFVANAKEYLALGEVRGIVPACLNLNLNHLEFSLLSFARVEF